MKIIAVVPAFNEFHRLQDVIRDACLYVDHVVVIDDGSGKPLSEHIQKDHRVTVLSHIINLGKGAALKTGVMWAIQNQFDVAVFIDADGQHDPHEIPKLLGPIKAHQTDIVFGVRKFHGRMPLVARFGNVVLTKAMHILYRIKVDDTQSGYRAMRLAVFEKILWHSPRYAVETEMIVNTGKHHIPFSQVPVSTIYHDKYKGTTVLDGIRIMINLVAWKIL